MFELPIWSIIIVVWALVERWPPVVLMWICWGQGVCFGVFIFLRVLLARYSSVWYKRARLTPKAFGFISFNLFFYLCYIYALLKLFEKADFDYAYIRMILVPIGLYFLSQSSCLVYRTVKRKETIIIDRNFFDRSLFRLVPMHIMIIGIILPKNWAHN